MKKILLILFAIMFMTGCAAKVNNQSRITVDANEPATSTTTLVSTTSTVMAVTPAPPIKFKTISYDTVVNSKPNSYIGKRVTWTGKIAINLSQISGIKFWIVDKQHQPDSSKDNAWFWAIPKELATKEDPSYKEGWNGYWGEFMFKNYSKIDYDTVDTSNDVFLVTGTVENLDCTYPNGDNTIESCVPNLVIEKIEKL